MLEQASDIEGLGLVLALLVGTAGAVRMVVFALGMERPTLFLAGWLAAMTGTVAVLVAAPALAGGLRPLLSVSLALAFVHQHDLPLAAVLTVGTLAAAGLEILRPGTRSRTGLARAKAVGDAGESLVAMELLQAGLPALHGVILGGRGWSTEIDHIVRTAGAIVAIETKTLAGRVEGRPSSRQWVQRLGGRDRWFLNPMWQNATHLEAIRQVIGSIDVPLRGIVVVAGTATISDELAGCVLPVRELANVLRGDMPIGSYQLDRAWSLLVRRAEQGGDRQAHAAYVWRRKRQA